MKLSETVVAVARGRGIVRAVIRSSGRGYIAAPAPGCTAPASLCSGDGERMPRNVDDILGAIRIRYKLLMADCKPTDRVVTRAAAGLGWFNVDKVQGEGELLALFGFDANGHEVMILQHHSQLNVVFTVEPAESGVEQKLLQIGFLH